MELFIVLQFLNSSEFSEIHILFLLFKIKLYLHLRHSPLYDKSQLLEYEHPPFLSGK